MYTLYSSEYILYCNWRTGSMTIYSSFKNLHEHSQYDYCNYYQGNQFKNINRYKAICLTELTSNIVHISELTGL